MSETQLTNLLGWLQEATYGVDPAQDTNQGYRIGKNVLGDYPMMEQSITINHNNNYHPSEIIINQHLLKGNLAFEPVNSLPLKYLFAEKTSGNGITESSGVFTIDPVNDPIIPNAQRNSWAFRTDLGNSTENLRDHYVGCMAIRYQEGMSFIGGADQRLVAGLDYIGQKRVTPATDVSKPPIYPDMGTTLDNESFRKNVNTVLKWDGDSLLPEIVSFNWTVSNEPQSHPVDGQKHVERVTTGNQTYGLTVNVRRAGGFSKQFHIDYRSQLDNADSYKTMLFDIYNTATNYKKYSFTGCRMTKPIENIIIDSDFVAHPTYQISLAPLAMTMTFKDGLNKTTFYNL